MMSEISRPARHARASPPPLMRLSCLRTILSCPMFARRAEKSRDGELVFQRDAFEQRRQQGRSAAGKKAEAQIVRAEAGHDSQDFLGSRRAFRSRFIYARRPGGMEMDVLEWPNAIGRHIDPTNELLFSAKPRAEHLFHRRRHSRPRLARTDNRNAANARRAAIPLRRRQASILPRASPRGRVDPSGPLQAPRSRWRWRRSSG